jgi:hypothetical protein
MGITPFVKWGVYSQTRADTVGLPGVALRNCAPCGIRSIGNTDAASILPSQLKYESPVLNAAVFSDCPEHLHHPVGLQMYYLTFGANLNFPDVDIAALIRVDQAITL